MKDQMESKENEGLKNLVGILGMPVVPATRIA